MSHMPCFVKAFTVHRGLLGMRAGIYDPYVSYMDFSKNERVDRYARSFSPTISPGAVVCSK